MLEIFLLAYLAKKNGNMAKEKGYSKTAYILLTIGLWVAGEFLAAFIGAMFAEGITVYVFTVIGAAAGAFASFKIVDNLTCKNSSKSISASSNIKAITTKTI